MAPKSREDIPPQKRLVNPMFYDPGFSPILSRHSDIWHTGMEWRDCFATQFHETLNELWEFYDEKTIMEKMTERVQLDQIKKGKGYRILDPTFVKRIRESICWRILSLAKRTWTKRVQRVNEPQSKRLNISWREIVVCPYCMKKLSEYRNVLECKACKICFHILDDDIPSFVNPLPVDNNHE